MKSYPFRVRGACRFALLIVIISGVCFPPNGLAEGPSTIKITTWNLQWFPNGSEQEVEAEEQTRNIEAAADVLRPLDSDILLLQEVRDLDSCQRLADAIKPDTYQVAICSKFNGHQQEAILAKGAARAVFSERWKSVGGVNPPRGFTFAWFAVGGIDIGVYSIHLKSNLGASDSESMNLANIEKREAATKQLLEHINGAIAEQMPAISSIIIGGDFNTNFDQPMFKAEKTLKMLSNAGFIDCGKNLPLKRRITHPANNGYPDATFDYLFVRGGTQARPQVITTANASDHFPVTCEFEFLPPVKTPRSRIDTSPERTAELVDVEIGIGLNLSQFGGPNKEVIILGSDISSVSVASLDYDHLKTVVSVDGVTSTYPTQRSWEVKRATGFAGTKTLVFEEDQVRVFFIDHLDTRQNHATLEIEQKAP